MLLEKIKVSVTVNVPIEKAWNLFTSPTHITHWYFASEDWHCPEAENDLNVGGHFRFKMAAKNEPMAFDFEGEYTLVSPYEKITYQLGDGRIVAIEFEKTTAGTKITETFDPEEQNAPAIQQQGWQAILDNFKIYAES